MDSFSSFLGYLGLFASAIIVITSVVTAFNYKGKKGESYSPLNHFVSELGEVGVAAYAAVFNTGLIFSGPTGKAVIVDFSPYFSDDRKFCELLVFAKDT